MPRKFKAQYEIISGIHSVDEALRANKRTFHEIYFAKPLPGNIAESARKKNIPTLPKSSEALQSLSGTDQHQQIAAKVGLFPSTSVTEMIKKPDTENAPLYLIVDSIEDPRNLGALIRTALCAGVSGVIVPKDRCAPLTPLVSRASAGAMEHCRICRVTNLVAVINELKKHGIWVTGLDHKGPLSIFDADMTGAHAIVIGGEHTGIRRLVAQNCDNLCHIPQFGAVSSLNASVAGAIAMYEAIRQRHEQRKTARSSE